MNPDKIRLIMRILNAFENDSASPDTDYRSVYIYHDGTGKRRQVTLARGFTDDGGNLKKVVVRYIRKDGKLKDEFASRIEKFGTGTLVDDKDFLKLLGQAADEQAMRDAQDEVFVECYLNPAILWAARYEFKENLSQAVIIDSYLQSGGMLDWLMKKFSELKPSSGGNEKDWIESYVRARKAWFARAKGPLHNCLYRPDFFLDQIGKGNWSFDCPLRANSSNIC